MGIEGGSNSEVQNQEINQANNEQNEINQAEHQRSGEELEGNSTIDNEGERKQIEGKDDATESAEDESSQLDKEDNIEDDPNTEQPPESDNVALKQQLDNQDTIESEPSGADEMGEDNNETVDSLDNDDEIEDSEDLDDNQDSTEGDIQDSLDTEDSIDSDETDDSVEEDDNNEQDPLDSEDSIEDDGEESENPEGEEDTENPEDTEESENPEEEDSENSEDTEESENPKGEEDTENPDEGEESETPEVEEDTENPEEEDSENSEDTEESENPKGEEDTENPEEGEESESPEGEEDIENPEDGDASENPENSEASETSDNPDNQDADEKNSLSSWLKDKFSKNEGENITPDEKQEIADRFDNLGINDVDLGDMPIERQREVAKAFEDMYEKYPELQGSVSEVSMVSPPDISNGTEACASPKIDENGNLSAAIKLNGDMFTDSEFENDLAMEKESGFAAGEGIQGVVKHELGHVMQLDMDAKSNGTDIGEAPTSSQWNDIIGEWNNNTHAEEICKAAMDKLGIGEDEIADYLSGYGSQDYGECFAEAISEVGSCEEPREFSKAIEEEYENYKNSISKEDSSLVEATNSDLTNGAIQEKEKHISEAEAREAFENKFHEIASGETSWNTPEKQESFLNTVDAYAERAVNEGAVESKTDFYEQYANRDYHYPAEYVDKIKEPFLNTGASSIVNQNAVINAFDAYGTIGRGTDGNFVTSIADDSRLCFDGEKAKDAETIADVKGVGTNTYASGKYQYEYDAEMVNSCNDMGLLQTPNGDTGGASSLNIPGCKTWAGENMNNSESELMMPSVICDGYDSDQVFSDISNKGCFEIQNPIVLTPNGDEVQVKGCFRIKEI